MHVCKSRGVFTEDETRVVTEALTVYVERMNHNVKEIQRAVMHEGLDGREAAELIKTFEQQKSRAILARAKLTD